MSNLFHAVEHKGAEMEARFYLNSKRVSRERFDHVKQMGFMYGSVDCFHTSGVQVGTRTRRANHSTIRY